MSSQTLGVACQSLLILTLTFCCRKSHPPGLCWFFSLPSFSLLTFYFYCVFVIPLTNSLICVSRVYGVPLTQSITVTHCFNVQLHMMHQAHNVLSLLIHWHGHFPLNSPLFLSSSSSSSSMCAFYLSSSSSPPPPLGPIRPHLHGNRQWG